jgi:hypothetical protein
MLIDVSEVIVCETVCGIYGDCFFIVLYCLFEVVLISV